MAWTPPTFHELMRRHLVGDGVDWRWPAAEQLRLLGLHTDNEDDAYLQQALLTASR